MRGNDERMIGLEKTLKEKQACKNFIHVEINLFFRFKFGDKTGIKNFTTYFRNTHSKQVD